MLTTDLSLLARVEVVCPPGAQLTTLADLKATAPFDPQVKAMITAFSRRLAQDPAARAFPEIVALAHWLRPRAILDLENAFRAGLPAGTVALGRGLALHFAPGNVDTIFLYSAMLSVLAGNATVVRVSSRESAQIALLNRVLGTVLADPTYAAVAARIRIIRYPRDAAITAALSAACDLRVIWGGDASVREIRACPLPPRARDLPFPDRWSLSVIDAAALNAEHTDLPALARAFANDAYWFGQMACSSPRLVLWHGEAHAAEEAARRFWAEVQRQAQSFAPAIQAVQYVDKLVAQCSAAINGTAQHIRATGTNLVSVAGMDKLQLPDTALLHIGSGLFWEARLPALVDLSPLLDSRSQTISSFGMSGAVWADWVQREAAQIDRIVPLGQALQFDTVWDGQDLLRDFTRLVAVRC
jgi:hypothetical protein